MNNHTLRREDDDLNLWWQWTYVLYPVFIAAFNKCVHIHIRFQLLFFVWLQIFCFIIKAHKENKCAASLISNEASLMQLIQNQRMSLWCFSSKWMTSSASFNYKILFSPIKKLSTSLYWMLYFHCKTIRSRSVIWGHWV